MNYQETLDFLYNKLPMFQREGAAAFKKDLGNIVRLCDSLNHPQNRFKSIHVAGTNGKGSTSHMLAAVLQQAGYKVGLYTSPHLKNFTERIRINGIEIEKEYVINFVKQIFCKIEDAKPSFFEITVAMAFSYFADKKVDVAVIEVGLGGRLDSTNIITPLLSVITNISHDHQQFLGNTLEEIAAEKAGIIKENIPVVIGEFQEETEKVFLEKAEEKSASICFASTKFELHEQSTDCFSIINKNTNTTLLDNIQTDLKGIYQQKNILGVYAALDILIQNKHFDITNTDIKEGLAHVITSTGLKGRWQVLSKKPYTVCDVGHNKEGLQMVVNQIEKNQKALGLNQLRIVLGASNDKDLSDILPLLPKEAIYYFCKADIPRGLEAEKLKTVAFNFKLFGKTYKNVKTALQAAQEDASQNGNDFVFVGGSVFVVAEVI